MTKKLKKKVKKITLTMAGSLISIIAVSAIGTRLLTMPKAESDQTLAISAESTNNTYAGEVEIIAGSNDRTSELSEDINIAEDGAILCNSIIQGARDNDLPDGKYIFRVEGKVGTTVETKDYAVELINFREDVRYSLDEGQTAKTASAWRSPRLGVGQFRYRPRLVTSRIQGYRGKQLVPFMAP